MKEEFFIQGFRGRRSTTLTLILSVMLFLLLVSSLAHAGLQEGIAAYNGGNWDTALKEFMPLANQGNALAQCHVGIMYTFGEGVRKNYTEAVKWYRKAAEQGNPLAQFMLGSMLGLGKGVPKDRLMSVAWIRRSAEQGFAPAEYLLGASFESGDVLPKDYAKAAKWYHEAAEQGYADAQTRLGWMYANGKGVPRDYVEAVKWYRKAANQGYAAAEANLGAMYILGDGVSQDYVQAYVWESLAASQGYPKASRLRDILRGHMTDSQITEGAKLVSIFTPRRETGTIEPAQRYHLQTNEISLIPNGGVYELPARINGAITLNFTLDSGASEVSVPADVVSTLVRTGTIQREDILPDRTFTLADGSEITQHRFIIRELDVGRQKLFNVIASVGPPDGHLLLGQTFLSRLSSWSIDNQSHVFIFSALQPRQIQNNQPSHTTYSRGTIANSEINTSSQNKWLVILGSDRLDNREKSEERLTLIKPYAPTARIVDSGTYPKLLSGWWVVVEGPFDKATAEKEKARLLPVVPDAFVRAGW